MKDNDSSMLFEAYRKIYEAPIDPGGSWDDDDVGSKFDKTELDKLAKYKVPDVSLVNKAVEAVKNFLRDHENSHYDGSYKDFRSDIIHVVKDATGINATNAKYVARVVQNALRRLDIITIDGATQEVEVGDVPEPEVDKEVTKKVANAFQLQFRSTYEISFESGATPGTEEYKAHEHLQRAIGRGAKATGRQIIDALREKVSYEDAKRLSNALLKTDGIVIHETEGDDEDKIPDIGDDSFSDDRYAATDYAQKHFGDLGGGSMSDY